MVWYNMGDTFILKLDLNFICFCLIGKHIESFQFPVSPYEPYDLKIVFIFR